MYLTEYNEERAIRNWRQDGIEEGRQEKAVEDAVIAVKKFHIPIDDVVREYKVDKLEIEKRLQSADA
ncbi:MAG: hypothetical protein J6X95_00600 [Treponema sp.]|nr:hypothetical protein [Treponema sp.]